MTGFATDGVSPGAGASAPHHGPESARFHLLGVAQDASQVGTSHQLRTQVPVAASPSARSAVGNVAAPQDSGRKAPIMSLFGMVRKAIPTRAEARREISTGAPYDRDSDPDQRGHGIERAGIFDGDRAFDAMPGTAPTVARQHAPELIENPAQRPHDDVLGQMARPHGVAFHTLANLRANWPHVPVLPTMHALALIVDATGWQTVDLPDSTVAVRIAASVYHSTSDLIVSFGAGNAPNLASAAGTRYDGCVVNPSAGSLYYVKGKKQISLLSSATALLASIECYIDEAG